MRNSIVLITIALFLTGCGGAAEDAAKNSRVSNAPASSAPDGSPEKKLDDFETRLNGVRTANFSFILAFRRKDGAPLAGEDKRFLKENSPSDVNQWVLTGDGKTVIAGTNYKFPPESLEALKTRFNIEDYSPPNSTQIEQTAGNSANVNQR